MALFGVRRQAHPKEPGGVHISFTYPVPSLRPAKEHVGGIQTVEVAASGQAGTGQGHHGGEDVQHTAGGSDRQPWPGWPQTLLAMLWPRPTRTSPSLALAAQAQHCVAHPPPAGPSLTFHLGFYPPGGGAAQWFSTHALRPGVAWAQIPVLPPVRPLGASPFCSVKWARCPGGCGSVG